MYAFRGRKRGVTLQGSQRMKEKRNFFFSSSIFFFRERERERYPYNRIRDSELTSIPGMNAGGVSFLKKEVGKKKLWAEINILSLFRMY
jgi:hypothetical protein